MSRDSRFRRLQKLSDGPYSALTVRCARRYLRLYTEDGVAWMLLGIALVELACYEEAEQALAKAIQFCPASKLAIPLAHMGHLFCEAGDHDQAAAWYQKAITANPLDATYHIFMGALRAKGGDFIAAEECYRTALQCREGCKDEAYLNLGFILRARERFSEAAECFREALQLDPGYRAARIALRDVERCIKLEQLRG